MKVLTFAASNSKKSINKQLAIYATSLIEDAEVEVLDINDFEMPIYSQDREEELGIPEKAKLFYSKIAYADAIVVAFAEHNGSYTAAYKNLFDWTSRIDMKVYQNKPMILLATSPGPGGASSVLTSAVNSAPFFGADVKASLSIPSFYDNFDVIQQEFLNAELLNQLKRAVSQL
ncbi:NADPH-dependent FMN reductase [Litorilituus lipolyticus]|uniref:NADPH-dependent oxidoreductase n=1 Tax=Litorilituus lipolyticus TaxID=2491017 RepID=A0A502L0C2_9GAMM|nr:NAD(P)H-dependent oxidoreductase [Litorilituus lipolyticus]TPH13907.1 NADPH-dependent oxidoreductase [Litorilituus lipolyticus]